MPVSGFDRSGKKEKSRLKLKYAYLVLIFLRASYIFAVPVPIDTSMNTWYGQGSHFRTSSKVTKKIHEYQKDLETNPKDCVVLSNIGYLFLEKSRPDSALLYYKQYKAGCCDSFYANLYLGWAYFELDSIPKAFHYFNKAQQIDEELGTASVLGYLDERYDAQLQSVPLRVLQYAYQFYPNGVAVNRELMHRYKHNHQWGKAFYHWLRLRYIRVRFR